MRNISMREMWRLQNQRLSSASCTKWFSNSDILMMSSGITIMSSLSRGFEIFPSINAMMMGLRLKLQILWLVRISQASLFREGLGFDSSNFHQRLWQFHESPLSNYWDCWQLFRQEFIRFEGSKMEGNEIDAVTGFHRLKNAANVQFNCGNFQRLHERTESYNWRAKRNWIQGLFEQILQRRYREVRFRAHD